MQETEPRIGPAALRRQWGLASGVVFLNHGSFGACPKHVLALQAELRRQMEAEPVQFLWRRYEERLEPSRQALAQFVGARARDLVFVTNATTAVNAVVRSIDFQEGDEILTTNLDYNACRNALTDGARRCGAVLTVANVPFPTKSPGEAIEAILNALTPRTRLAMIDHVTSGTALVLPIKEIILELEKRGVDTLVDGAHVPGMLPLNLDDLRPAYYTGNLHKWVCAPKGAAFLYAREDKQKGLRPCVVSHGLNTPRPGYTLFQDLFDWTGTSDPTAWMCVGEAITWMENAMPGGWAEVRKRNRDLTLEARRILSKQLHVESPCPEDMLGSMATLPLPEALQNFPRDGKIDPEQIRLYEEHRIEVPFFRFGTPERRWFRISAQLYNTLNDYRKLGRALTSLVPES